MTNQTWIRRSLIIAAATSFLGLADSIFASPTQAITLDFGTWQRFGDVTTPSPGSNNLSTATTSEVGNFSGTDAAPTSALGGTLETDLGFQAGELDPDPLGFDVATEGSGLRNSTVFANAGDRLDFNWTFLTNDSPTFLDFGDYAFIEIRNSADVAVLPLDTSDPLAGVATDTLVASSNPTFAKETSGIFSFTFTNADTYDIAIGIVDVGEVVDPSALQITNAELNPIPFKFSPGTSLLALAGLFGGYRFVRWKTQRKTTLH